MARMNMEGFRTYDMIIGPGCRFSNATLVPVDNYAISASAPPLLFLNPAGAVDVLLPTSSAARKGLVFILVNLSGNVITLKTDADAAFTTAITVAATATTRVVCTGDTSQVLGWRAW